MTEALLTAALLVIPVTGGALSAAMPRNRYLSLVGSAALLSVAASVWLACLHVETITSPVSLSGGSWLVIPSTDGLVVQLLVQADRSRVLLVLAAAIVMLLECIQFSQTDGDTASNLIDVCVLLPLSVLAILAADIVVLVCVWILIDCCVYRTCSRDIACSSSDQRATGSETVLSGASVLLLLSTLMASARFGTTSLTEITGRAIQDNRIDATAVVSGLSVLFFASVAVRCAFFPALVWPRNCLRTRPVTTSCVVALAGVLPGTSLALAMLPLREISAEGGQLVAMLGVLTCLMATAIALVQKYSAGISTLLVISSAGLSAVALGTMHPAAGEIAACTLFAQAVAVFVIKQRNSGGKSRIVFGLAMAVALSGIGGSNAILSSIEPALNNAAASGQSTTLPSEGLLHLMWWGVVASQVLWGLAVARLISRTSPAGMSSQPDIKGNGATRQQTGQTAFATTAAILAVGACILPLNEVTSTEVTSPASLFSFGAATPACLLGAVIGWLLSQASDAVRDRIAIATDSLTRLCREWFYLEDFIRYGVALPTRIAAIIAETVDRKISGGTSESGWEHTPSRLAGMIEQQQKQPAVYYGLTGLLVVVGLLWSVF